jgi:hypothetical protein
MHAMCRFNRVPLRATGVIAGWPRWSVVVPLGASRRRRRRAGMLGGICGGGLSPTLVPQLTSILAYLLTRCTSANKAYQQRGRQSPALAR